MTLTDLIDILTSYPGDTEVLARVDGVEQPIEKLAYEVEHSVVGYAESFLYVVVSA